jgi:hypothetical protein
MNISSTEWTPLTEDMYPQLYSLYDTYWLASTNGTVFRGSYYCYRESGFLIDNWVKPASEISHIMRLEVPNHPSKSQD